MEHLKRYLQEMISYITVFYVQYYLEEKKTSGLTQDGLSSFSFLARK